ncbi:MAG: pitrilysin family protein [bacterium]|nr:pitrilysin family protein [bacterium]
MKHTLHKINLKSGAKLLAINVPNAATIDFRIYTRAGYRFTETNIFELPHLMEHLAFEGNKTYPDSLKFAFEIEKNGAYTNAYTNASFICYHFITRKKELKDITDLALIQLTEPLFKEKSINHEKETIINELSRNLANDSRRLFYFHDQVIVPSFCIPWEERINIVKKIKRKDILDYYSKTHVPKNLFFVIAGDLSPRDIDWLEKTIEKKLKGKDQGKLNKFRKPDLSDYRRSLDIYKSHAKEQTRFVLSFINEHFDLNSWAAISILRNIYAGGFSSRIFQKARKAGLSYGPQASFSLARDYSFFSIDDETSLPKVKDLFELMVKELVDVSNGNFTNQELERAKGYSAGKFEKGFQLASDFADWYGTDITMDYPLDSPANYISRFLAIKKKDVVGVAERYITKNNWVLTLMGENLEKEKFRKVLDKYLR